RAQEARAAAAAAMPPPPPRNPVVVQPGGVMVQGGMETQGGAPQQAFAQAPGQQMVTMTREEMQRIAAAAAAQAVQQLFGHQSRAARQEAMRVLMNMTMREGTPVREHVLAMMAQLNELEVLGAFIDGETQVDIVLQSLPKSFEQFRLNYNMNKMLMTLPELVSELQSAEGLFRQKTQAMVAQRGEASTSKAPKDKKRKKSAGKGKAVMSDAQPRQKAMKPKGKCHNCQQKGHWKANCPFPKNCRAFLSTLRGGALDWFQQLPPGSIADFEDFAEKLTNQYSSAVAQEKTFLTLMAMRQGEKESLRKYIARYNQACLEIPSAVDEVKSEGLIRSLRAGPCRTSLAKTLAHIYDEVLKRCRKYINLEETEAEFAKLEEFGRGESKKEKAELGEPVRSRLISMIREFADVFAYSTEELTGIKAEVIEHRLNIDLSIRPVKQKRRHHGAEMDKVIELEVEKLLMAGHIKEIQFPKWLSNTVMVSKSEGKWRMCIDFRDLNKACPKDLYPLPRIDQLVDSTTGCELLSLMDASQGYHQIPMAREDWKRVSFVTSRGTYYYVVMSFGLKNAGATYQRLVDKIFKEQLGRNME
ncbi:Unknown protein, partial [Striga hermonthica]